MSMTLMELLGSQGKKVNQIGLNFSQPYYKREQRECLKTKEVSLPSIPKKGVRWSGKNSAQRPT